ncbi:MAG: hypothetical protein R6W83_06855 [Cryobacterium sp.]
MPRDDDSDLDWLVAQADAAAGDVDAEADPSAADADPTAADAGTTLPTPPAPWWTAPLESPWAATATPISRSQPAPSPSPAPAPAVPASDAPEPAVSGAPTETLPGGNRPGSVQASAPVSAIRHTNWRTEPGPGTPRSYTRPLIWSSVVVGAVIVLVSLFFLGTQLAGDSAPATLGTGAEPSAQPSTESAPAADVTARAPAGIQPWTALSGGECLGAYDSPWQEEFSVVACAEPHTGQLVFRGDIAGDPATVFPGEAALAAQIPVLCTATDLIDTAAAAALGDVQVQGSYPVTAAQWDAGQRQYYCFVSRSGGEPFTASLAGPRLDRDLS